MKHSKPKKAKKPNSAYAVTRLPRCDRCKSGYVTVKCTDGEMLCPSCLKAALRASAPRQVLSQ